MIQACSALVATTALLVGCSGAHFNVHVRDARAPSPIPGASVLLFDVRDDVCSSGASGGQLTDAGGNAAVNARWCGAAKVVVAANGYSPVTRRLDSCDAKAMVVELARFGPEPVGNEDPRALVARELLIALIDRNTSAIQRLLADPTQASLYGARGVFHRERPQAIRFAGLVGEQAETTVQFDFYYEDGCRERWLVRVIRRADEYRVADVSMAEGAD